jgi:hypothetical protein
MRSTRPSCSKSKLLCLWVAVASPSVSAGPPPLPAPDFSADIVSGDAAGSAPGTVGRLYVAGGKVRIEAAAIAAGFFVVDGEAATALFVRPAQRVFMDARQSTVFTRIFLPLDPQAPCPQWQAAARNAGIPDSGSDWHCERMANADTDNRHTVQYTVVSPGREWTQRWIDADLEFPIKLQAADGTTLALEHIRVEAQPPSLFALPAGYRKADPQALIDRIRHSDVWVEPAK